MLKSNFHINKTNFLFLIGTIYSLLYCSRIFGFEVDVPQPLIALITIIIIISIILTRKFKITRIFIIYFFFLIIELLIDNPSPIFKSTERLANFIIILMLISPVIINNKIIALRTDIIKSLTLFFIILSVGSFVAYFFGINLMKSRIDDSFLMDYQGSGGKFSGLTNHSMMLGPISSISSIWLLFLWLKQKKYIYLVLVFICISTVLMAASRGALYGLLSALMVFLYLASKNRLSFFKKIFVISICSLILLPLWGNLLDGIKTKNSDTNRDGTYGSRTVKVISRLNEFDEKPLFGTGFCAINPNGIDRYNPDNGQIEPGSSWLAILSMTGISGFIFFIIINYKCIKSCQKSQNKKVILFLSLLVFFWIHMLVEGYIFSISNVLAFYFWLLLGNCFDLSRTSNEKKKNNNLFFVN